MNSLLTYRATLMGGGVLLLLAGFTIGRLTSALPSTRSIIAPRPAMAGAPRDGEDGVITNAGRRDEDAEQGETGTWGTRWANLQSQPASGTRESSMLRMVTERAAVDPLGALEIAGSETNVRFRRTLINAVLGSWASNDPAAAVNWAAMNVAEADRGDSIKVIVDRGMSRREETAGAIAELCRQNPLVAADYGRVLIEALGRNDDFKRAVQFAAEGTGDNRSYWFSTAFFSWAQYRPQEAASALKEITEPTASNEALHGLVYGWASNDPVSLLQFALEMPAGNVRKTALNEALQHWVTNDPSGASAWLASHGPSLDVDSGALKLATDPDLIASEPETALQWATRIVDPQQRTVAMTDLIQQWWARNPVATRRFVESSSDLLPELRVRLLRELDAAGAVAAGR